MSEEINLAVVLNEARALRKRTLGFEHAVETIEAIMSLEQQLPAMRKEAETAKAERDKELENLDLSRKGHKAALEKQAQELSDFTKAATEERARVRKLGKEQSEKMNADYASQAETWEARVDAAKKQKDILDREVTGARNDLARIRGQLEALKGKIVEVG